jgi:hypothetical protein
MTFLAETCSKESPIVLFPSAVYRTGVSELFPYEAFKLLKTQGGLKYADVMHALIVLYI